MLVRGITGQPHDNCIFRKAFECIDNIEKMALGAWNSQFSKEKLLSGVTGKGDLI